METIVIEGRFRGPPSSGNGGYVGGVLARHLGACAEVTLRRPTPLDAPLELVATREGVELRRGADLIAEGRPAELEIGDLPGVSFAAAEAAAARPLSDPERHLFSQCFVCGCRRPHGDGLRLFPGAVNPDRPRGSWLCAAPWRPAENFTGPDGRVDPAFIWAALDCPAGMSLSAAQLAPQDDPLVFLLGRQTVRIDARPRAGERCVVATWPTGQEGRKHYADGALLGENGEALAVCRTVWIEVDRQTVFGESAPSC